MPERTRNNRSFLLTSFTSPVSFLAKTISHAIINTIPVRIAVAQSEFTFSIPNFERTEVIAANIADKRAKKNQVVLVFSSDRFISVINHVPAPTAARQISLTHQSRLSAGNTAIAMRTEKITLDLSTAATFETSPSDNALK